MLLLLKYFFNEENIVLVNNLDKLNEKLKEGGVCIVIFQIDLRTFDEIKSINFNKDCNEKVKFIALTTSSDLVKLELKNIVFDYFLEIPISQEDIWAIKVRIE